MLVRSDLADGVLVLTVEGPLLDADVATLCVSVSRALTEPVRGVVLDLGAVDEVNDVARCALQELAHLSSGWPRAALVVASGPTGLDLDGGVVLPDRAQALAHVDDRQERPRAVMSLDAGLASAAQARAAVAACSDRLGLDELSDDVVLVVSEMVTNAVRHAVPPVRLEIEAGEDAVVVAVCDGSPQSPVAREADLDAEGGRGMLLVDLLSDDHGVRAQPPGKAVWAMLLRRRSRV
ncbi:MAG: ATP-binding protein [Frankiaceae bacterium]|nr:ATP-binding protein [Frankiaceae bacterium]